MQQGIRKAFVLILLIAWALPVQDRALASQRATPLSESEPITADIQFDVPLTELPGDPSFIGMARLIIPPGSGIAGGSIPGNRLFLVESGGVIVTSSQPVLVWRDSDASNTEPIEPGSPVGVSAGDLLIAQGDPPESIQNIAEIAAVVLDIVVWPGIEENVHPFLTENGVVFDPLAFGELSPIPETPARLVLQDRVIPLGASVAIDAKTGPTLLHVQTGILGIAGETTGVTYSRAASNNPGSVPGRLKALRPGTEALLTAGGAATIQMQTIGEVRNLGRTDLALLELRILPLDTAT